MRGACLFLLLTAVGFSGCVAGHLTKDIPPPGGCDRCHTQKISSNWTVSLTPIQMGREGGVPDGRDIVFREIRQLPVHQEVPTKRLEVFTAQAPPETVGNSETGIQCFACHKSPGKPHETVRGQFPHPWGTGQPQKQP